jgi:hypothetical protein
MSEKVKIKSPKKGIVSLVKDFLNGNALTSESLISHLPFLMLLVLLGLFYIANGYMAEDTVRKINKRNNEIKELRSEYISLKSELMYKSKQSELADIMQNRGLDLVEASVPPGKIVLKKNHPYFIKLNE